jgi:hypothetical protein
VNLRGLKQQLELILCGLIAALLPWPESEYRARAWGVDVAPYSLLIGIVEAPVFALLFFFGAIAYMQGSVPFLNMALVENWFPGMNTEHVRGAGLIAVLAWFLHPLAWLFMLQWVTGTLRLVAFATSRLSVGEPLVWATLRITQALVRAKTAAVQARNLGPLRPDRLVYDAGCDLEIHTCRERPDWSDGMGLGVNDRFFRLLGMEQRYEDPHHVLVYRFQELDENEVIRRPVIYRDVVEESG